jgi:hypothetical protein
MDENQQNNPDERTVLRIFQRYTTMLKYNKVTNNLAVSNIFDGHLRSTIEVNLNHKVYGAVDIRPAGELEYTGLFDSAPNGIEWGTFNNLPFYVIEMTYADQQNLDRVGWEVFSIVEYSNILDSINQYIASQHITLAQFTTQFTLPNGQVNYKLFINNFLRRMIFLPLQFTTRDVSMRELVRGGGARIMPSLAALNNILDNISEIISTRPLEELLPELAVVRNEHNARIFALIEAQRLRNEQAAVEQNNDFIHNNNAPPPPNRYPNTGQRINRFLPVNATNSITAENIENGVNMVNFHGEGAYGRYYTANTFRRLNPVVHIFNAHHPRTGYKKNPITRQFINPENVVRYTARFRGKNNNAAAGGVGSRNKNNSSGAAAAGGGGGNRNVINLTGNQQGGRKNTQHKRRISHKKRTVTHKRRK